MNRIRNGEVIEMSEQEIADFEASQAAPVPQSVTALQGMTAIDAAGMAEAFDAWANDPARTFLERAFINKADTWRWDDPVLAAGCVALGIDEQAKTDLFILAANL